MITYAELEQAREDIKAAGFVWDPSWQGYERWTHVTKGITCIRQLWMSDSDFVKNIREKIEQANKIAVKENKQSEGSETKVSAKFTLAEREKLEESWRQWEYRERYSANNMFAPNRVEIYQYQAGREYAKNMHERDGLFFEESGENWTEAYANGYFDYAISVKKKAK